MTPQEISVAHQLLEEVNELKRALTFLQRNNHHAYSLRFEALGESRSHQPNPEPIKCLLLSEEIRWLEEMIEKRKQRLIEMGVQF